MRETLLNDVVNNCSISLGLGMQVILRMWEGSTSVSFAKLLEVEGKVQSKSIPNYGILI